MVTKRFVHKGTRVTLRRISKRVYSAQITEIRKNKNDFPMIFQPRGIRANTLASAVLQAKKLVNRLV